MKKGKISVHKSFWIFLILIFLLIFVMYFLNGSKISKQNIEEARRNSDLSALLAYSVKAEKDTATYAFIKALELAKPEDKEALLNVIKKRPEFAEYYNLFAQENDLVNSLIDKISLKKDGDNYMIVLTLNKSAKLKIESLTYKRFSSWKKINFFTYKNSKSLVDKHAVSISPISFSELELKGEREIHIPFTNKSNIKEFVLDIKLTRPMKIENISFIINLDNLSIKRVK